MPNPRACRADRPEGPQQGQQGQERGGQEPAPGSRAFKNVPQTRVPEVFQRGK